MTREILLKAKNLSVGYADGVRKHVLFENIDLELSAGELVCFMGANGIGKSSLIRTLAGLQAPLSKATIAGLVPASPDSTLQKGIAAPFDFAQDSREKKISVVLTDRVNAVNMTVAELVALGRYPYLDWNIKLTDTDKLIIERAIHDTHIQHIANKKLYELSDGQLQMAMIARALAQDTPIILLDEPTAHLDLNNRVEIMNLLRKLARTSNKAILVATHELDLALQTADLIWLAGRDKKLITGIPEDLVLNGSFDEIFKFKGFDLKTGKVFHEAWRNKSVKLTGEGFKYLWTKNALERNGYKVEEAARVTIIISNTNSSFVWKINNTPATSLQELFLVLSSISNQ
jgi:iron complex transport system ATP-binding protein